MKGLFIVFHGFAAHNGISKKIFYQCDALRRCGAELRLCSLEVGRTAATGGYSTEKRSKTSGTGSAPSSKNGSATAR